MLVSTISKFNVLAKKSGKEVGFVTTAYVNHASPSGLYAKVPYRFWYSDGDMVECLDCKEQRSLFLSIDFFNF